MKLCVTFIILSNLNLGISIFPQNQILREHGTKTTDHSHCEAFLEHMKRVAAANNVTDYKSSYTSDESSNPHDFKSNSWEHDYGSSDEIEEHFTFLEWTDYPNKSWLIEADSDFPENLAATLTFQDINFNTKEDQNNYSTSKPNKIIKKLFLTNPKPFKVLREHNNVSLPYLQSGNKVDFSQNEGKRLYLHHDFDNQDYVKDSIHSVISPISYRAETHQFNTGPTKTKVNKEYQIENSNINNSATKLNNNGNKNNLEQNHNRGDKKLNEFYKKINSLNKPVRWANEEASYMLNSFLDKENTNEISNNFDFDINSLDVNDQVIKKLLDIYFDLLKPIHVWVTREKEAEAVLNILKYISSRKMYMSNHKKRRFLFYDNNNNKNINKLHQNKNSKNNNNNKNNPNKNIQNNIDYINDNYYDDNSYNDINPNNKNKINNEVGQNKIIDMPIDRNNLDMILSLHEILELYKHNLIQSQANVMVHLTNILKLIQSFMIRSNKQDYIPEPQFTETSMPLILIFLSLDSTNMSSELLNDRNFILWMINILAESMDNDSVEARETVGYVAWVLRELLKNAERTDVSNLLYIAWKFISEFDFTNTSEKHIIQMIKKIIPTNPAININNPEKAITELSSLVQSNSQGAPLFSSRIKISNIEPEIRAILNIINNIPSNGNSVLRMFSGEILKTMSDLLPLPYHDETIKRNLKTLYGYLKWVQYKPNREDMPYKDYSEIKQLLTQLNKNLAKDKRPYGKVDQFIFLIGEQLKNNNDKNSGVVRNKLNEVLNHPNEYFFMDNVLKQLNHLISSSVDSQKKSNLVLTLDTIIESIVKKIVNNAHEEFKQEFPITLLNSLEKIKMLPELQNSDMDYLQQLQHILSTLLNLPISDPNLKNVVWLMQQAAYEVLTDAKEKNIFVILKDKIYKILNVNSGKSFNDSKKNIRNKFHKIIVILSNEKLSQKDKILIKEEIKNISSLAAMDDNARQIINRVEIYLQNLSEGEDDERYSNFLVDSIANYLNNQSKGSDMESKLIKLIHDVIKNRQKTKNRDINNILLNALLFLEHNDDKQFINSLNNTKALQKIIEKATNVPNLDTEIKSKLKYILEYIKYAAEADDPLHIEFFKEESPESMTDDDICNGLFNIIVLLSNQKILPNDELVIDELLNNVTRYKLDPQVKNILGMVKSYLRERKKNFTNDYQLEAILIAFEQFLVYTKPPENSNHYHDGLILLLDIVHKNREISKRRDLNDKLLVAINLLHKYNKVDMEQRDIVLTELKDIIQQAMLLSDLQTNIIDDLKTIHALLSNVNPFNPEKFKSFKNVTADKASDHTTLNKTLDSFIRALLVKVMMLLTNKDISNSDERTLTNIVSEFRNKPNIENEVENIISMLADYLKKPSTGINMVIVKKIEDYLVKNSLGASQHYMTINKMLIDGIKQNRNTNKNQDLDTILFKSLLEFQHFDQITNNKRDDEILNDILKLLKYALKLANLSNDMVHELTTIMEIINKTIMELDLNKPRHTPSEQPMKMPPMQFEDKNGTLILEILFKLLHKKNEAGIDKEKINKIINLILAVKSFSSARPITESLTPVFGYRNIHTLIKLLSNITLENAELTDLINRVYEVKQTDAGIDLEIDLPLVLRNIIKLLTEAFKKNIDLNPSLVKKIIYMTADVMLFKRGADIVTSSQYIGSPQLISSLLEVFDSNYPTRRGSSSEDVKLLVEVIDVLQRLENNIPAENLPPVRGVPATVIMYVQKYLDEAVQNRDVKNKTDIVTNVIDIVMIILRNNSLVSDTLSMNKQRLISTLLSVININQDLLDTPEAVHEFIQLVESIITIIKLQNGNSVLRLPPMLGTNQNFILLLVKLFNDKKYQEELVRNIVNLVYEKTEAGKVLRKPLLVYKLLSKIFGKENFGTGELLNAYPIVSK